MSTCRFAIAWQGPCGKSTVDGEDFCKTHLAGGEYKPFDKSRCVVCKEQATHECSETFQFVCGFPLCDKKECKHKHHPGRY